MIFTNDAYKQDTLSKEAAEHFVQMLAPLAPHIAEELWQLLGHEEASAMCLGRLMTKPGQWMPKWKLLYR